MKSAIHAVIGSALIGAFSAFLGFTFLTWQFWVLIILCNTWYFTRPRDVT